MTGREWEVLHQLVRSRGSSSLRDIAARLGVSLEYARLLCRYLYTRHLLDQGPGEVFTLTADARNLVERRAWARGERVGSPPVVGGEGQIDRATVQSVADSLSEAVQRSIQRQLRRGAGSSPLLERDPVTIKTTFDDPTDATLELETNLREPAAEAPPGVTVRKQAEALQALRTGR